MANKIHPGQPHEWLWLGPDVRHQGDGTFKEVCVRVCVVCFEDSAPSKDHCKLENLGRWN
jgi:hypothetical protein